MADVVRTLWLGSSSGGLLGSSLPGKRLCWRQQGGLKTLIVYLSAGEPSPPSAPFLGCCGVVPRKTGREGQERRKKEGAKLIQGPGPKYHDQHRAFHGSECLHPASIVRPFSLPGSSFGLEHNFDTAVGNSVD